MWAGVGVVAAAGLALATARWIVWPQTSVPANVDAIVVLGGGSGQRTSTALELARKGVSSTLVVSTGPNHEMEQLGLECGADVEGRIEVVCFDPDPARTVGEARAIADLAQRNGWHRVGVVTSTYHLTRARVLIQQCYTGELHMVEAPANRRTPRFLLQVPRELAGLAAAVTFERAC